MKTARKNCGDFPQNCHNSMADFFLPSFFFQLRQIPGLTQSSRFLCPLKPQILILWKFTAHLHLFLRVVPLLLSPLFRPRRGLVLPAWEPGSRWGSAPGSARHGGGVQPSGSRAQPEHAYRGGGTADGAGAYWPVGFPLCVWSRAGSSPRCHWKLRGDFPTGRWRRDSLSAFVR